MGILSWIVLGFLAGLIAKTLLPGPDPGGCIATTVIGIVGAVVGGMLSTALGFGGVQSFDLRSMAIAILGSVLFLALLRVLRPGGGGDGRSGRR